MLSRASAIALAMLLPAFAASLETGAQAPLDHPCDQPVAGLPCNLRTTFAPNNGNENYIAINPLDPENFVGTSKDYGLTGQSGVLACNANNVWTGYYTTKDGGRTWTNGYARGYPSSGTTPISKYKCSTDAVIATDNAGTFYLSGLAYNSTGAASAIWVARSTDGGLSFEDPRIGDEANFNDKNWLAVDPETKDTYITWTHFNANSGIWFKRSLGGTLDNWDARKRLSTAGGVQGSFPAVGPDGTVYVIYNDNILGGNGNLYIVKSTDHGATFTPERAAFQYNGAPWNGDVPYRTPNIPALAIDRSNGPFRGTLYVTYQGQANGDADSFLRYSRDGGETWSGEIRLNDDAKGNGKGQNFATVAVDSSTGWVHTVWYDRRDDPGNRAHHTYYAVSKDGGASWSKNQRVSTHLSAPDACRHQDGSMFIGDYLGLAASGGKARPLFVDTRNGRCDLYTALLFAGPRLQGAARPHANISQPEDVTLTVQSFTDLDSAKVEVDLPLDWSVDSTGGGELISGGAKQTIRWTLGAVSGDRTLAFRATPSRATVVDLQARMDWSLTVPGGGSTASGQERWNATVLVSYPVLQLDLVAPARMGTASAYNVTMRVLNKGYGDATGARLELTIPQGMTAVPRGGSLDPATPAVGLGYGKPLSDPAGPAPQRLAWTIGTLAPGTDTLYLTVMLSPATSSAAPFVFTSTLTATAPDNAPLRGSEAETLRMSGTGAASILASPGVLVGYLSP